MVLSPLYDRVFYLFLTLSDKFHHVHLDNLYMSAKCVCLSYTHQNLVKVKGFCQTVCWAKFHYKKPVDWVRRVILSYLCCTYFSSLNQFLLLYFYYFYDNSGGCSALWRPYPSRYFWCVGLWHKVCSFFLYFFQIHYMVSENMPIVWAQNRNGMWRSLFVTEFEWLI